MSERECLQRGFCVRGRVQGVFFRAWTRSLGEELGLRGTVRNRLDGSVEVHALGPPEALEKLEARLWEGPPAARVERVEAFESPDPIPPLPFRILPSGS